MAMRVREYLEKYGMELNYYVREDLESINEYRTLYAIHTESPYTKKDSFSLLQGDYTILWVYGTSLALYAIFAEEEKYFTLQMIAASSKKVNINLLFNELLNDTRVNIAQYVREGKLEWVW